MRAYAIAGMVVAAAEVLQLVLAERVIGMKTLRSGGDPRDDARDASWYDRIWLASIVLVTVYPFLLLFIREARLFGGVMLGLTLVGYSFRRQYGLRYALVVLTLEGALRIGVIVHMIAYGGRYLR